jgi:hypothetical protein
MMMVEYHEEIDVEMRQVEQRRQRSGGSWALEMMTEAPTKTLTMFQINVRGVWSNSVRALRIEVGASPIIYLANYLPHHHNGKRNRNHNRI